MSVQFFSGVAEFYETAPAKINLALHVVGQRADGYHLLETLVTFTDAGDRLSFAAADVDHFSISGPFSALLANNDSLSNNLVLRARDLLRQAVIAGGQQAPAVAIHLEKNLPIASGIGGGSADAAATLRGLLRFWQSSIPTETLDVIALSLGADVPMCFAGTPLMARGIGEELTLLPQLPAFAMVLANPLMGVSTPEIFRRLQTKNNPHVPDTLPQNKQDWQAFIHSLRNDLEAPATVALPVIREVSDLLQQHGATLVRMSGSGATCFGIFPSFEAAQEAEASLAAQRPDWYFKATMTKQEAQP